MIAKILLCLLCFAFLPSAEALNQRFSREALLDEQAQDSLAAIDLDAEVYANSLTNFQDLRLLDQQDTETPFWLKEIADSQTVTRRINVSSEITQLNKSSTQGFEVIAKIKRDNVTASGVTIITPQRNFEYALTILGSAQGEKWQILLEKAVIYDYSQFMDFDKRDIELPPNQFRFFKFVLSDTVTTGRIGLSKLKTILKGGRQQERQETVLLSHKALHIDAIKFWRNQTETRNNIKRRFEYPIDTYKVFQNKDEKQTIIDIEARLLPLNGFQLAIAGANFSRSVELQTPVQQGVETRMQTLSRGKLEALHFKDFHREQLTLKFPGQRREKYRLIVFNDDNPPLKIEGVIGLGFGYQLLFFARPEYRYQLLYGAVKAAKPVYDIVPIQELLSKGYQGAQGKLADVSKLPESKVTDYGLKELLDSEVFLGLVMTLMILVLIWSIFQVSKHISKLDDPPGL